MLSFLIWWLQNESDWIYQIQEQHLGVLGQPLLERFPFCFLASLYFPSPLSAFPPIFRSMNHPSIPSLSWPSHLPLQIHMSLKASCILFKYSLSLQIKTFGLKLHGVRESPNRADSITNDALSPKVWTTSVNICCSVECWEQLTVWDAGNDFDTVIKIL